MEQKRENWGSKLGVILAVAGSAVGLGNFLVFPGRVAANGGGAFMIPYLVAFVLIGIPLAWMEWGLGRHGGRYGHGSGPGILDKVVKKPYAKYLGSVAIWGPLLVFFLYVFIESWLLGYTYYGITGALSAASTSPAGAEAFFNDYITLKTTLAGIPAALLFFLITFVLNFTVIYFGIRRGIEFTAKILMPMLLVLGVTLMIKTLTLPGITEGLNYMWKPDFSQLLNVNVWFSATSQIFFTLSVGLGTILTYASYVKPKQDIALSSLKANATNEFVEVIIGGTIVIPMAVVLLGAAQAQSVASQGVGGLGFITMPFLFDQMGEMTGYVLQILWFLLLFIGGITSSVSILQPPISFLEDEMHLPRHKSVLILGAVNLFFSLIVVVGFGTGIDDELDLWGFQFAMLLMGTIEAVIFAWVVGMDVSIKELEDGAEIAIPKIYRFIMQYITPTFLVGLLILWFSVGGGMDKIMLTHLTVDQVSFMGIETTNKVLILFTRGTLVGLLVAINVAIFFVWKKNNRLKSEALNG